MLAPQKPIDTVEFVRVLRLVQAIVDDEKQRKQLLGTSGDIAQEWLDLFQLLAEYPNVPKALRSSIFSLMIRLSRNSGLYPQCLAIRGVEKLGKYPVGGGAFGDVWQGKVGEQLVCLKMIRVFNPSDVNHILKDYMQEAILWRQLNHPNVLPFMGIFFSDMDQKQLCLVSPWMERGNLVDFLKTSQDLIDLDLLAYDVACGLSHLHAKNIVHGDLKAVNILITPDLRACITDFGLSRVSATQMLLSETSRSKGTMRWLSPELMRPGPRCVPSSQSDVYAYACVCYEIFTGNVPFYEVFEAAIVFTVLIDRQHPTRPTECSKLSDSMWDMMLSCWNEIPSSRPTMVDVLGRLHGMNADQLEPASEWSDSAFTQIWNDVEHMPVVHAGEADQPRNLVSREHARVWERQERSTEEERERSATVSGEQYVAGPVWTPARKVLRHRKKFTFHTNDHFDEVHREWSVAGLYMTIIVPHGQIKSVAFKMVSRDQGWSDLGGEGTYHDSHTWFEASILQRVGRSDLHLPLVHANGKPVTFGRVFEARPFFLQHGWDFKFADGDKYAWRVHNNITALKSFRQYSVRWVKGAKTAAEEGEGLGSGIVDGKDFVEILRPGNMVVLWARAQVYFLARISGDDLTNFITAADAEKCRQGGDRCDRV
ncbi:kinase-like protein [Marasmius fiardii PR-910]|nr:kinase-like protein [Marasmius fiardii PR-910]